MMSHPRTRDLARRLFNYEAMLAGIPDSTECVTLRIYEKLRQGLGEFAGVAGFQSLASRALALARSEVPSLGTTRITGDGSLQGLGKLDHQIDVDKDRAGEGEIILISSLLGLLLIFLGEAVTLSLLKVKWPNDLFDDHSSGNERKA
jgi:hypothetical protein